MPKTKKKNTNKPNCKCKCCPLTAVLIVLVVGLTVFSGYLFCNRKTNEDKKRLQLFETILESDVQSMIEGLEGNTVARTTEAGVTKENDIYVKFKYIKFEDVTDIPLYINTATLYYPCGNNDGKTVGTLTGSCGKHLDTYNKKDIDEATRNRIRAYSDRHETITKRIEAIWEEDGVIKYNNNPTEAHEQEIRQLQEEDEKISEKIGDELEAIWNYL